MAILEQWVNLTPNDKWKGEGLTHRWRMGVWAKIKVKFARQRRAVGFVTLAPAANNAVYSAPERQRRSAFRMRGFTRRRVMTNRSGEVTLRLGLNLAGGDEWDVMVADRAGNEIRAHKLVTRRKLYFQVVRMVGAAALSGRSLARMRSTFWGTSSKLYVKMVEVHPGETIPGRRNYDDTDPAVVNAVMNQLRAVYDDAKRPYEFVTMLVRRNGIPMWEDRTWPAANPGGGTLNLQMLRPIFDIVDPAVPWFGSITYQPVGGAAIAIPQASLVPGTATPRVARLGQNGVSVNFSGLPPGPGAIRVRMRTMCVNGRGVSLTSNNLTLVATEDALTGAAVPQAEMLAVMIHELGHKIGMVQGGAVSAALDSGFGSARPASDRGYLDRQATYYWARGHSGGHCHTGAPLLPSYGVGGINPTCTMFGDTRSSTPRFCATCRPTIRKLDLRSSTNPGIRTQF